MVILHDSFVLNAEDGIEVITPDKSFANITGQFTCYRHTVIFSR